MCLCVFMWMHVSLAPQQVCRSCFTWLGGCCPRLEVCGSVNTTTQAAQLLQKEEPVLHPTACLCLCILHASLLCLPAAVVFVA